MKYPMENTIKNWPPKTKEVEVIYIKRKLWERTKELSLLEIEKKVKGVLNQFK